MAVDADDFINGVAEVAFEALLKETEVVWKGMYHNAAITVPDFDTDNEAELFWEQLASAYNPAAIEAIENAIHETYGENITLQSYGRCGATFAPADYMGYSTLTSFGSFGDIDWDESDPGAALETLAMRLDVIRFIDAEVRQAAEGVAAWWAEEKVYWEQDN